ncbi:hypothetical protein [Pseudomonas fluorescens]|uniref:hypothetical protein n=1 Tax=Pseudomonas fluorescens TaxID=294 RepID=UPI003D19B84E
MTAREEPTSNKPATSLSDSGEGEDTGAVAPALKMPTIIAPLNGRTYIVGRVYLEGKCSAGARVELWSHDNSKLADAIINSDDITHWYYSRIWDAGDKHVKVVEFVGGVPSEPTLLRQFRVTEARCAPAITSPSDQQRLKVGRNTIKGTCWTEAISVRVLNHDNSELGTAKMTPGSGTWEFEFDFDFGTGRKHILVRQVVAGESSDISRMFEYFMTK